MQFRIIPENDFRQKGGKRRHGRGRGGQGPRNQDPFQAMLDAEKYLEDCKAAWQKYERDSKRKLFAPNFWVMVAWSPVIGTVVGGAYLGIGYIAWTILKNIIN